MEKFPVYRFGYALSPRDKEKNLKKIIHDVKRKFKPVMVDGELTRNQKV